MTLIRNIPAWSISENHITPESAYFNRRQFLKSLVVAGIGT